MLSQVEQILDIFDVGEDRAENDQLNFSQFHSKVCCRNYFLWVWKTKYFLMCLQVLAFLTSGGDEEKVVHYGSNSMKERRKSVSNSSSSAPNSSNSNFGQRRKSLSNSSSSNITGSNMMGERRSSFSNISGHSPPSTTLSPPPAVQVLPVFMTSQWFNYPSKFMNLCNIFIGSFQRKSAAKFW